MSEVQHQAFDSSQHLTERCELYSDCFPEAHVAFGASEDHYRWKFHSLEDRPTSYEFASWSGKELLGYYAAIPFRYTIKGHQTVCGMVCDVMTHSRARGKGIFTGIGRFAMTTLQSKGVGFVSGYPIRPEVLPGHLKVGWKVAFDLPLHLKVLRTNSALGIVGLRWLSVFTNFLFLLPRTWLKLSGLTGKNEIEITDLNLDALISDPSYEALLRSWSAEVPNTLNKTPAFLRWRLSSPRADYGILGASRGNQLVAVVIFRKVDFNGIPCIAVLDFMVADQGRSSLALIHQELEKRARGLKAEIIVLMASRFSARRIKLLPYGFIRGFKKFQLILNILDPLLDSQHLLNEKNWDLFWIDSDDN